MLTNRGSLLALAILTMSCRTTTPVASTTAGTAAPTGANSGFDFPARKEQERFLFLKMLAAELKANVPVEKDRQHLARGVLECRQSSSGKSCFLKTFTAGDSLSADQDLPHDVSDSLWNWVLSVRPELDGTGIFSVDLGCTFLGKQSPPFEVEDVTCRIRNPGLPQETHYEGPLAEEIYRTLGGPSGILLCRVAAGSGRKICVLRRQDKGMLHDQVSELGIEPSQKTYDTLAESLIKLASSSGDRAPGTALPTATEIPAHIACWRDEHQQEKPTICRSRIGGR
jgi:hypothetical protein